MWIERKLRVLGRRLDRLGEDLEVANEQLAFLMGIADEAETDMIVSETPLAARDHKEASGDLERHRRYRFELEEEIRALRAEQNRLLEQLGAKRRG